MSRALRSLLLVGLLAALVAPNALAYKVARTPAPPTGTVGIPYSFTFKTEGGTPPHELRVHSGEIPPGLTFSSSGVLSGVPTRSGSFSFYIEAKDANGALTQVQFTIGIALKLTVTTESVPAATRGVPYGTQLAVSGGIADSWSVSGGSLPPGLTLSNSGVIAGTPTAEGVWTFTVKAVDDARSDTKTLTIMVAQPIAVQVGAIPPAVVGTPFATKLTVTGGVGAYSFRLASGAMPDGLTLDSLAGTILGTPRVAGQFVLPLAVTASGGGQAVLNVPVTVTGRLGFATGAALPSARLGRPFTTRLTVTGGVGSVSLSSTSLFPPGLSLNGDSGKLSGRPKRPGTYRFTVVATDSFGGRVSKRFTLVVRR